MKLVGDMVKDRWCQVLIGTANGDGERLRDS
jgi:hypothetical protein